MRLRSAITALAVCTTSATLLAGCSPDPVAAAPAATSTSTPPAPSASPTPSPTLTMPAPMPSPTPPAEMSQDDEAGAVAAATYFLNLYTYTESTQDTAAWTQMSHPDCAFCMSVTDDVATQAAAGHITRSAPMTIASQQVEKLNPLAFSVTVSVTKDPEELWTKDGQLIERGNDLGGDMELILIRQQGFWLVREVSTSNPITR